MLPPTGPGGPNDRYYNGGSPSFGRRPEYRGDRPRPDRPNPEERIRERPRPRPEDRMRKGLQDNGAPRGRGSDPARDARLAERNKRLREARNEEDGRQRERPRMGQPGPNSPDMNNPRFGRRPPGQRFR